MIDLNDWRKRKLAARISPDEQRARDHHPSAKSVSQAKDEIAALISEENVRHTTAIHSEDEYHFNRVLDLEQLYVKFGGPK